MYMNANLMLISTILTTVKDSLQENILWTS